MLESISLNLQFLYDFHQTNATESEQADEGGAPCITAAKGDQKMLRKKWAAVLLLLVAAWWLISICEWSLLWADDKVQEEEWIRMAKLKGSQKI